MRVEMGDKPHAKGKTSHILILQPRTPAPQTWINVPKHSPAQAGDSS